MIIPVLLPAVFLIALVTASCAVPPVTRFAIARKLLDFPDGGRRAHSRPVPRLGGVAVFAGFIAALVCAALTSGAVTQSAPHTPHSFVALLMACGILFAIGVTDDVRNVRPVLKLLGQTLAALIVFRAGFAITVLSLPLGYHVDLGWLSLPLTVMWLVGMSNAFNLVDGLDGLAGGVGVIALGMITASALVLRAPTAPVYSVALIGALLGFLRYNVSPARIFLGDSGSLIVGFLLAYLAVKGATRSDRAVYAVVPLFALSYPILDTSIAILRRWLRGQELSRADGRHIHHQLRAIGIGPRESALLIYFLSILLGLFGLSITFAPPHFTIVVVVAGAALLLPVLLYGLRKLEYHEFVEAGASFTSAVRTARIVIRDKIHARDVADLIRGADSFERLGEILNEHAHRFRFVRVVLQRREETRHFVEPLPVQIYGGRISKLEYPVMRRDEGWPHLVMLTIWCATEEIESAVSAERIARILAPAIRAWLATHWWEEETQATRMLTFVRGLTPPCGMAGVPANSRRAV